VEQLYTIEEPKKRRSKKDQELEDLRFQKEIELAEIAARQKARKLTREEKNTKKKVHFNNLIRR
jgi:hypothetical protein